VITQPQPIQVATQHEDMRVWVGEWMTKSSTLSKSGPTKNIQMHRDVSPKKASSPYRSFLKKSGYSVGVCSELELSSSC
jgi:hypothetical protein